jgi:hypothetical protein
VDRFQDRKAQQPRRRRVAVERAVVVEAVVAAVAVERAEVEAPVAGVVLQQPQARPEAQARQLVAQYQAVEVLAEPTRKVVGEAVVEVVVVAAAPARSRCR